MHHDKSARGISDSRSTRSSLTRTHIIIVYHARISRTFAGEMRMCNYISSIQFAYIICAHCAGHDTFSSPQWCIHTHTSTYTESSRAARGAHKSRICIPELPFCSARRCMQRGERASDSRVVADLMPGASDSRCIARIRVCAVMSPACV